MLTTFLTYYSIGMVLFITHFMVVNGGVLRRKKIMQPLVMMTLFYPLTYLAGYTVAYRAGLTDLNSALKNIASRLIIFFLFMNLVR